MDSVACLVSTKALRGPSCPFNQAKTQRCRLRSTASLTNSQLALDHPRTVGQPNHDSQVEVSML